MKEKRTSRLTNLITFAFNSALLAKVCGVNGLKPVYRLLATCFAYRFSLYKNLLLSSARSSSLSRHVVSSNPPRLSLAAEEKRFAP